MSSIRIRKRGKMLGIQFLIRKRIKMVDGIWVPRKPKVEKDKYISSTNENKKDVSNVFDSLMSSETINNIIKYEIAY